VNGGPRRSQCPTPVIGDAQSFLRLPPRPSPGRSAATLSRGARGGEREICCDASTVNFQNTGAGSLLIGAPRTLSIDRNPVSRRAYYGFAESPVNGAHALDERQTPKIVWFLALLRVVVF
jgi:hypothetical protein